MEKLSTAAAPTSNYRVKRVEPIMTGSDVQARLFTLAPGETIPWHFHRATADHYFVLEGALTVVTREPETSWTIGVGSDHRIAPGTAHLIANRSTADCRFLLLQGVGKYDWVKASD
jgi:quercetin dioxygenase-like cupin family protein